MSISSFPDSTINLSPSQESTLRKSNSIVAESSFNVNVLLSVCLLNSPRLFPHAVELSVPIVPLDTLHPSMPESKVLSAAVLSARSEKLSINRLRTRSPSGVVSSSLIRSSVLLPLATGASLTALMLICAVVPLL